MDCGKPVGSTQAGSSTPTPDSYTPRHLADKILTSRSALEGERKQVTVLFADLKGSVDLSGSLDPEEWHEVMNGFFALLSDGVHRFEGTINQFTGDGIMALFGAPIAHEDHAHRACYAALYLREELRRFTEELKRSRGIGLSVRMGLNSGEVVVGRIGDDLRMDYTAHGQTVGLADRMQQLADPGTIYVSDATAGLVTGFLELRDLGEFELKGAREPVRVYELERQGALRTRLDLSRSRGLSRFIGRETEMKTLEEALASTLRGQGRIVAARGEAGIGKSRLFYELLERCRTQGIEVHSTHGVPYGKAVPLQPILELFRSYFGMHEEDPPAEARRKIAGTLLLRHEDAEDALPLVFDFLGVPDPDRPAPDLDPQISQEKLFAIFKGICAPSRREPLLLVFEDLHWFDGGSESFLAGLAEAAEGTPTLLLMNYRPEYSGEWLKKRQHAELRLTPLGDEAISELLGELLGEDLEVQTLADRIRERAAGNPFFVEEVVQSLIESGSLAGTRGAYRLTRPVDTLAIPATVQAVLTARIDRLSERDKEVLQTAAVIGKEFAEELLARVVNLPQTELDEALRALESSEFIYTMRLPPCADYAFRHPLTQEVAYRSQLNDRRARIHADLAKAIEAQCPGKLDECAALLAHHWEQAGNALTAAPWHMRAGKWIATRDPAEALRHFRKVVSLLETIPDSPETLGLRVTAHAAMIRFAGIVAMPRHELMRIFADGKALAKRSSDPRELATLLTAYSTVQAGSGDADSALEHSKKAVRLVKETGDVQFEASLRATVTFAYYAAGYLQDGLDYLTDLEVRLSDEAADPRGLEAVTSENYISRGFRALMLTFMGRLEEAERDLDDVIRVASERGQTFSWAHGCLVDIAYFSGRTEKALAEARASVRSAEAYGSPYFNVVAYRALGLAHHIAGELTEAIDAFDHARTILRDARTALHLEPAVLALLSDVQRASGDLESARVSAVEALDLARERHTRLYELRACIGLAEILRQIEGVDAISKARALLDEAEELIEATGGRSYAPFLRIERAALADLEGDSSTRERELQEAHRLFTEMGASPHAEAIAAKLR
jgi:class 3 adenylate cyclase/tetratricopeptide (TPR) repeat protein